jgi:hypothetical protein
MKNGFGGDFEGQVVRLGNGSAIGKADKLLKIVEGRGGWGYQKRGTNWRAGIQSAKGVWCSLTDRREVNMTRGVEKQQKCILENK